MSELDGTKRGMQFANAKLRRWLGGLDSNQDNQIQNLMYCQLYDLPSGGSQKQGRQHGSAYYFINERHFRQPAQEFSRDVTSYRLVERWQTIVSPGRNCSIK